MSVRQAAPGRLRSLSHIEHRWPEVVLGVQGLHVVQFDMRTMRMAAGTVGDPPLGSRKAGRGVGARPGILHLVRRPWLGGDLAMRWLPQPNQTVVLTAQHDCVVPPPHHDVGTVRASGDRDQMAGRHPLDPRRGEHWREPGRADFALAPDVASMFTHAYYAGSSKRRWGEGCLGQRSGHMPESHSVLSSTPTEY